MWYDSLLDVVCNTHCASSHQYIKHLSSYIEIDTLGPYKLPRSGFCGVNIDIEDSLYTMYVCHSIYGAAFSVFTRRCTQLCIKFAFDGI